MAAKGMKKPAQAEAKPYRYTRESILGMRRYYEHVDLLVALLRPRERYTLAEVDGKMEAFLKGKVK